jgi:signal transduction histidine kinase
MDEETLTRIREPLFTTRNFGTGLGLPAVGRIVELHGGGMDISSRKGHGAVFTLWFPVNPGKAQKAA